MASVNKDLNDRLAKGCWAVIFNSIRELDPPGYAAMDDATMKSASEIPGFLGYESVRNGKEGMFISYWESEEAIEQWKNHPLHLEAKKMGKSTWYDAFRSVVCRIESTTHLFR